MKKHLKYLMYLMRHKWYVLCECKKRGILWRGLTHDLSKFRPSEWFAFVNHFYGDRSTSWAAFFKAKTLHEERNPHHWECWVIPHLNRVAVTKHEPIEIPESYRLEMLCDLIAFERAGGEPVCEWYKRRKDIIKLHPLTRFLLEHELKKLPQDENVEAAS